MSMKQEEKNLSLLARLHRFSATVECSVVTDKDGAIHDLEVGIAAFCELLSRARSDRASVFVIGNGGSAAIASHVVIDFVNVAKLRAVTLHEPSMLTCFTNDFGYEYSFSRALERLALPNDVLVAISSSGSSRNILNAAIQMAEIGGKVITLSGFAPDNPLRTKGLLNFWLDVSDYGLVEVGHQFILHNIADRFAAELGHSRS